MLPSPWDLVLTVVFATTGGLHLWSLAGQLSRPSPRERGPEPLIDLLHLAMSASMIAMTWWPFGALGSWVQNAALALFAVALASHLLRAHGRSARVDLLTHLALVAAMIWMLAAMPLMGHPATPAAHAHHDQGAGMHEMPMDMATPAWVSVISWLVIVLSALAAVWWLVRLRAPSCHRWHAVRHALMGAGMALMTALMLV